MARPIAALAAAAMLLAACVAEPSLLCDRERLVWSFDEIEFGPEHDVSDAPGIQIDVLVRTSLEPGTPMSLVVATEEESELAGQESVREDGSVLFGAVSVPVGNVTLRVSGSSGCREIASEREIFVFDELGRPECLVALAQPAIVAEAYAPAAVLNAAADGDPAQPDFQADFIVSAGRPDVLVRLLVLDLAAGVETALEAEAGDDRSAAFAVTLGQGMQAVRAVCEWPHSPFPLTTPTHVYFVDTVLPECELLEPTAAIGPADDLDADPGNGIQFRLRGRAVGDDVVGQAATFRVNGAQVTGSPLDQDGESEATGVFSDPPPAVQVFGFSATDHAGNPCEVEAMVELEAARR